MDETPADRLRQARIARGYRTAKQFSDTHGLAQSTYSVHESGGRKLTRDTALRYADILKISVEWLLTGKGEGPEHREDLTAEDDLQDRSLLDDLEIIGAHDPDERANYEAMIRNRAAAVRARRQRDPE